jgi:hypothetical protein
MKSFRFVLVVTIMLTLACGLLPAQFGKRLGEAIQRRAEDAVIRKAEDATEKAVDAVTDPDTYKSEEEEASKLTDRKPAAGGRATESSKGGVAKDPATGRQSSSTGSTAASSAAQTPQDGVNAVEMAYAKSDFVAGDEIIFEDDQANEKLGEFPSQWDLIRGNVEIAKMNGENAICLIKDVSINPLMKNPKDYLPETFTVEFDFYMYPANNIDDKLKGTYQLHLQNNKNQDVISIWFYGYPNSNNANTHKITIDAKSNGENRKIEDDAPIIKGSWNRLSVSFNKRALKVYLNGVRVANAPNVDQANWFYIQGSYTYSGGQTQHYIKNVRVAKGAVPLYDRMLTDGKFITYGITFDVGKSTINPKAWAKSTASPRC